MTRTVHTSSPKTEMDIHDRLNSFHSQFKSVHNLEDLILSKLQTDSLKTRSLKNMFRSLTEGRKSLRIELYGLQKSLVEQQQIDRTMQLEVEFYVFQDEYQHMVTDE